MLLKLHTAPVAIAQKYLISSGAIYRKLALENQVLAASRRRGFLGKQLKSVTCVGT
jgi:hypothetical protein